MRIEAFSFSKLWKSPHENQGTNPITPLWSQTLYPIEIMTLVMKNSIWKLQHISATSK
jgi:hypothetical protein